MLISIIIPAYKAGDTIGDALNSVWRQSFNDYEIIVVDDCSPDDTVSEIVRVVESEKWKVVVPQVHGGDDPGACRAGACATPQPRHANAIAPMVDGQTRLDTRSSPTLIHSCTIHGRPFRLFRTPRNMGPAGARNTGIAAAKGEWIAFLDGDDVWMDDRLTATVSCIHSAPDVGMWCGDVVPFGGEAVRGKGQGAEGKGQEGRGKRAEGSLPRDPRGGQGEREQKAAVGDPLSAFPHHSSLITHHLHENETSNKQPDNPATSFSWRTIKHEEFIDSNPVATSTVTVRRDVLNRVGGFDVQFRGPEDYDLWMRLATVTELGFIQHPLAGYRRTNSGLSLSGGAFLRQILLVIDKAFAPGGAFHRKRGKRRARAYQLFCAAWAEAERGHRSAAMWFYVSGMIAWPFRFVYSPLPRFGRTKLFWRIIKK